jgi:hypothetical protein
MASRSPTWWRMREVRALAAGDIDQWLAAVDAHDLVEAVGQGQGVWRPDPQPTSSARRSWPGSWVNSQSKTRGGSRLAYQS